jgi:hypothetical protein
MSIANTTQREETSASLLARQSREPVDLFENWYLNQVYVINPQGPQPAGH